MSVGAVAARRRGLPERIAASDLGLVAGADFLHIAYALSEERLQQQVAR